jgi:FkbM family methyltransferase
MDRGLLWRAWHYAHAVEGRLLQRWEWSLLRKAGIPVSDKTKDEIWRSPGESEDWVNLARFLNPSDPIYLIDVGANTGDFTVRAQQEYADLRVVGFEPVASNFAALQKRFAGNSSVTMHNVAASNEAGQTRIYIGRSNSLFSLEKYTSEGDTAYGIGDSSYAETETIECRTLDSFALDPQDRKVLLKVDVQGHEESALDGATATLRLVDVAIIECSFANEYQGRPPSFAGVVRRLAAAGLYPVVFQDYGRTWSTYAFERDVIFVRENLLKNLWYVNYGIPG